MKNIKFCVPSTRISTGSDKNKINTECNVITHAQIIHAMIITACIMVIIEMVWSVRSIEQVL